ncbi:MAG: acyltransferase [Clostridia bacterium]|nr:acyltransferase [Clostridia bacterium]
MRQRIFYLDFLRSFAIIMVLLLHSISGYMMQSELYNTTSWYINLGLNAFARTGVPLFLMISGVLMLSSENTRNITQFYKKSLLHIAIPLVFFNIAYFIFRCARGYAEFDIKLLLDQFLNCGTEYHLWYLYTIIGIYLIAPFLKILTDNLNNKQLVWLLVLMMFGTTIRPFINTVTPVYIYFFEPLFNGYAACFMLGYVLSVIKCDLKTVIWFLIAGLLGLFGSVILNHVNSSANEINLVANNGYSLCHFAFAASIFMLARLILSKRTFLSGIVTTLSKASFGIYLTHVAVIDIITNYFMIDASPIVCSAYIFAVATAVSFVISFVLGKIKYIKKIVS